ncbi:MAG: acyltransferase [Actinomycetia bacterium]|nr:acyltransferase [Actinomycetes bacterium]
MNATTIRELTDATPTTRNRVVDFLRAVAISVVVLGHWLMAAVVIRDGEVVPNAVLNIADWTHPLTWIFQVMPIFFLVGGYANALSWRSAQGRGENYASWLRARLLRLGGPVVPLLVTWLVLAGTAYGLGVPGSTLRMASQVALVPTWFLAAYVLVVAVAPVTLALWQRLGWWSVTLGLGLSLVIDVVSISTGQILIGFLNYLIAWATVHQLGYAWLDGALATRLRRIALAATGFTGLLLAVTRGPYPISMIGIDGAELNNSMPTRVTMLLLGMAQGGLILLAERPLARWLQRRRAWLATVAINARIMTLYLWHLTAMVLVIGLALLLGGVGMQWEPLTRTWWATRPLWFAVLALVVFAVILLLGRLENPPGARTRGTVQPRWLVVLACVLTCGGLAVMAKFGIVSERGVNWIWPLLPLAAQALLRWPAPTGGSAATPGLPGAEQPSSVRSLGRTFG